MSKKLDVSVIAISDNIVYTKKGAWAYYVLPENAYDYLSWSSKIELALRIESALASIVTENMKPVECHLLHNTMPFDVDSWESQLTKVASQWTGPGSNYPEVIAKEAEYLLMQDYTRRITALGIYLGPRNPIQWDSLNVLSAGFKSASRYLKKYLKTLLALPKNEISEDEEKIFKNIEEKYYTILSSGNLRATRESSEEILYSIKKVFYPAMPVPYLNVDQKNRYGSGDILEETAHVADLKHRFLKITQIFGDIELSGYRATLTFSKFPDERSYPDQIPFLYEATRMGSPFTISARFRLLPSAQMKKKLSDQRKKQVDENKNYSQAGNQDSRYLGVDPNVSKNMEDLMFAESAFNESGKTPWVEGSYRITIEADSEENLLKYISTIKQVYQNDDITLRHTSGDQLALMLEEMPGDYQRIKSFNQITNLAQLSTSGVSFGGQVGDPVAQGRAL